MDDIRLGVSTRFVLLGGLLAFLVLALVPNCGLFAIYVTTLTPIAGATVTGIELIVRQRLAAGVSLIASVLLIAAGVMWGIR